MDMFQISKLQHTRRTCSIVLPSSLQTSKYSRTPLIRTLVIRTTNCPDRLGPSGKFVENSTKLYCLELTGYRIKYSTVQCCGF